MNIQTKYETKKYFHETENWKSQYDEEYKLATIDSKIPFYGGRISFHSLRDIDEYMVLLKDLRQYFSKSTKKDN